MSLEDTRTLLQQAKEAAKEAKEQKKTTAKKTTRRRSGRSTTRKPPASIEPGFVHYKVAAHALRLLGAQVESEVGTPINLGTKFEELEQEEQTKSEEPLDLAARLVAHAFYRIPFLRDIGKRMEGKEKKAGVLSDFASLAFQLYERNPQIVAQIRQRIKDEMEKAKAKGKTQAQSQTPQQPVADIAKLAEARIREGEGGVSQ